MNLREVAELADVETFGDVTNVPSAHDIAVQAATVSSTLPRRMRGYAAALVSVAAVLTLLVVSKNAWWPGGGGASDLAVEELITGTGETNTIVLSDGSIVRMGPESRLRISVSGSGREVILNGRAFFVVATDPDRTFRVITPGGAVRALGTRFQVEADASEVQVVVVEGRVALDGIGDSIELGSGQMVQRRAGVVDPIRPAPPLSELSNGWLGHFLAFKNAPLSRVIDDIESMYDVDVVMTEAVVAEPTVTMWLADSSLENTLTIICNVINADCSVQGKTVTIDPR